MPSSPPLPRPESGPGQGLRLWLSLPRLLAAGNPTDLAPLVRGEVPGATRAVLFWTVLGIGVYGATMGLWRGPQMATYTGIKLAAVVLLTGLGNGLLNGFLAALTGSGLDYRATLRAILISFATLGVIALSLTPLTAFQALELWSGNAGNAQRAQSHQTLLLSHTLFLALGGMAANLTLLRLLLRVSDRRRAAMLTFGGWLLGNLVLGAQIGYTLRPFFGSAGLPVQFLREDPLVGNFYESVWRAMEAMLLRGTATVWVIGLVLLVVLLSLGRFAVVSLRQDAPKPQSYSN